MTRLLWCAVGAWMVLGAQSAPGPTPSFVDVPIRIIGVGGQPARGVPAADLEAALDAEPIRIESLMPDSRSISLGLIVDTTFSGGPSFLNQIRDVVKQSVLDRLQPGDRVRISGLHVDTQRTARFLDQTAALRSSLDALFHRPDIERAGPSPIWDAMWDALHSLEEERGRPVVLVATDGRSTGNLHGLSDVLREAIRVGASVDVFYGGGRDLIRQEGDRVASVRPDVPLRQFAAQTGGELFDGFGRASSSGTGRNALAAVLRMAVDQLRHGYLLRLPVPSDGKFHALSVKARQSGLIIRAPEAVLSPMAHVAGAHPR
jgi:hypothetical protein